MSLYRILFDSVDYFVEANSMTEAIGIWDEHVQGEWGEDYDGTEEPESCELIHDGDVIRHEEDCKGMVRTSVADGLAAALTGALDIVLERRSEVSPAVDGIRLALRVYEEERSR